MKRAVKGSVGWNVMGILNQGETNTARLLATMLIEYGCKTRQPPGLFCGVTTIISVFVLYKKSQKARAGIFSIIMKGCLLFLLLFLAGLFDGKILRFPIFVRK